MKVLPRHERTRAPWRNGRGWTRTVAQLADGSDSHWRVSLAEITGDGPFSRFPGVQRVLVLAEGAGLALTVDGVRHPLDPLGQLRFDGGAAVSCELGQDRAVTALNVMCAAGAVGSAVEVTGVAQAPSVLTAPTEGDLVVVSLADALDASRPGEAASRLGRWDALWCRAGESVSVVSSDGPGLVAVVTLDPTTAPRG